MMNKYGIIIFLSLIVFLAGCKQQVTETEGPFIGGKEGLSIEFVNLAPPSQFNQNEAVSAKVLVRNNGENVVAAGNAKARIYGVNLANFGLTDKYFSTSGTLQAKGEFTAEGGEQEIDFGEIKYNLPIVNSEDFTLRARLCYPYQTKAQVDVCIKSQLSAESGEAVCNLESEKITTGSISAAPIQITSITEQTRGSDQVRFDILIENKGTGQVFAKDATCEDLDDDFKRGKSKDKVHVKINSPTDIICSFRLGEPSGEGIITLENAKETLSCWKNVEDTYVDKLSITLSYMYRDSTSKEITIFQTTS